MDLDKDFPIEYAIHALSVAFSSLGLEWQSCAGLTLFQSMQPESDTEWCLHGELVVDLRTDVLSPIDPSATALGVRGDIWATGKLNGLTEFSATAGLRLNPSRIAGTDIIIAAAKILPELNTPTGPRLVLQDVSIQLPLQTENGSPIVIQSKEALFTAGGVTAVVKASESQPITWDPSKSRFTGNFSAKLGGFAASLQEISIAVVKNSLIAGGGKGKLRLPFFEQNINIDAALAQGGGWHVTLAPDPGEPVLLTLGTAANGLVIDLASISLASNPVGPSSLTLTGTATLMLDGEASQTIPIPGLELCSDGTVNLKGGWLPLANPVTAKLGPFSATISRLGFKTLANGDREIAVDAAVQLSTSMPAGASAKGLRLRFDKSWKYEGLSFDGIGVTFTVPKVLTFKGDLAMKDTPDGKTFEGNVKVTLFPLDAYVDGQVCFGSTTDKATGKAFNYFAIKLDLELSSGIKLFSTGLSIYGLTGLFATNYAPNKTAAEKWFALPDGKAPPGWLQKAPAGVAELSKWTPKKGTLAFGAGVTVATTADGGKPFNGNFLLLITLPGPVVFLEGRANLMKDRGELKKDAAFRAYAVLDGLAGTAQFGLDARWRYPEGGEVIDISGSSEAFFDFHDASKWYVKIGLETPESARIKAKLVSFIEANAFLLIDAKHARAGGKAGWQFSKKFGPVNVGAQIWYSAVADISWSPPQLQAKAGVAGAFWAKAFGYGISGAVNVEVTVDAWRPFHVLATGQASGSIPIYGSFSKSLAVEWTQPPNTPKKQPALATAKDPPRVAAPLGAVSAAHALTPVVWPLALVPSVADAKGYLPIDWAQMAKPDLAAAPPPDAPVLPLDVRLDLTFARPVADAAQVGINGTVSLPAEVIGNPLAKAADRVATVQYALHKVELSRWDPVAKQWTPVAGQQAQAGSKPLTLGELPLYGAWIPDVSDPTGLRQQRLRLFAVDPLEALQSPSGVQAQQAAKSGAGAAGFEATQELVALFGFSQFASGPVQASQLSAAESAMPQFAWSAGLEAEISVVAAASGLVRALRVAAPVAPVDPEPSKDDTSPEYSAWLARMGAEAAWELPAKPQPVASLVMVTLALGLAHVHAVTLHFAGSALVSVLAHSGGTAVASATWAPGQPGVVVKAAEIGQITLISAGPVALVALEVGHTLTGGPAVSPEVASQNCENLSEKMALLASPGIVLPPHSSLRLVVDLAVEQVPRQDLGSPKKAIITQVAHFRTGGGPGLANLALPSSGGQADVGQALTNDMGELVDVLGLSTKTAVLRTPLNTLAPYVARSFPPSAVPGAPARNWLDVDVGLDFAIGNMRAYYWCSGQDLAIRVRDRSGAPVRDRQGRRVGALRDWLTDVPGPADGNQKIMLAKWKSKSGLPIDPKLMGLCSRIRWTGGELPANAGLMAELVPLLLADALSPVAGTPPGWSSIGALGGSPGKWQPSAGVGLTVTAGSLSAKADQPVAGGAALVWQGLPGAPLPQWSEIEASVLASVIPALSDGWLGLAVRCDAMLTNGLLWAVHPTAGWRRLVVITAGKAKLLAEDRAGVPSSAFRLSLVWTEAGVEARCEGDSVFSVSSPVDAPAAGSIALFASGAPWASFADVVVEDLSAECPILHRHGFMTGSFRSLQHLAATAPLTCEAPTEVPKGWKAPKELADLTKGVLQQPPAPPPPPPTQLLPPPTSAESALARTTFAALAGHFDTLRSPRLGLDVMRWSFAEPVTGLLRSALLVRWPDNLDWRRLSVGLAKVVDAPWASTRPGRARIGDGSWSGSRLQALDVTLVDAGPWGGATVETLDVGDPLDGPDAEAPTWTMDSAAGPVGLLWRERFSHGSAELWQRVPATGTSVWAADPKGNTQFVSQPGASAPVYLSPAAAVADLRVAANLECGADTQVGLVLRHGAADSAGPGVCARIVVSWQAKSATTAGGLQVSQDWLDQAGKAHSATQSLGAPYTGNLPCELEVLAVGSTLAVFLQGQLAGLYRDPNPQPGRCGLWAKGPSVAHCLAFSAATLDAPVVRDSFGKLDVAAAAPWSAPAPAGPLAVWSADPPQPDQTLAGLPGSAIPVTTPDPKAPDKPAAWKVTDAPLAGTAAIALAGAVLPLPGTAPQAGTASDWLLMADVRIDGGGVAGIAAEWRDADDCTLVAVDTASSAARLVNVAAGKVTVVQPSAIPAAAGVWQRLAVRLCERHLTVWCDGSLVAIANLTADRTGGLALFATGAKAARFRNVVLLDLTERLGAFRTLPLNWLPPNRPATPRTNLWLRQGRMSAIDAPLTGGHVALVGEPWWDNYVVTARLRLTGSAKLEVVARWQDAAHHAALEFNPYSAEFRVDGVVVKGGVWTAPVLAPKTACEVRLLVCGPRTRVEVDGWVVEHEQAGMMGGRCGIRLVGGEAAWLEAFDVRPMAASELATWTTASGGTKLEGWTVDTAADAKEGSADWKRSGSAIVQESNVWLDHDTAPEGVPAFAMRGTVLWAGKSFGDTYRLSVDIGGDGQIADDDPIGVQIGASPDDSDWLRFSLDDERKVWRVVRKKAGQFEELWSRSAGLAPSTKVRLALAKDWTGLRGWVDGIPAFWLAQITESLPRVGLYCWANDKARFTNLQIAPGPWRRDGQLLEDRFAWQDGATWTSTPSETPAFGWSDVGLTVIGPAFGTARLQAGHADWSNYRVTLAVQRHAGPFALAVASDPKGELQLRVDAQGPGANEWKLVHILANATEGSTGNSDVLCKGNAGQVLPIGKMAVLTIDVWARGIRLWADGLLIAAAQIKIELKGKIALIAEPGSDATVHAIGVDQARWQPLARLPQGVGGAGTTLTVAPTPTNSSGLPASGALAALPSRAWPAQGPMRVRLRAANGQAEHEAWLRANPSVPVAVNLQRGRDGSEVALVEPSAGAWAPAQALALTLQWNGNSGSELEELPVSGSTIPMQAVAILTLPLTKQA